MIGFGVVLADWPPVLRAAVRRAREHDVATTAQALAYALFLAVPSFLLVLVGVFSLVADQGAIDGLIGRVQAIIPAEAAELLRESLARSAASTGGGVVTTVVGFALALWSTTSAATTLMAGMTRMYGRRDTRGFVRKRLLALAIVGCLGASALLVFGLLVLGPHLERWTGTALGAPTVTTWIWWTVQWPILVLGLLGAFAVLLELGPDVDRRGWRLVTPGALTAVVLWLLASGGFALYSAHFGSYDKTWGTLSAVVVMLVWLWLTSAALLLAAEVNMEAARLAEPRRRLDQQRSAATAYEPLVEQEHIDLAVHWVLGEPGVFLNSAGDLELLPRILDAAARFEERPAGAAMDALNDGLRLSTLFV